MSGGKQSFKQRGIIPRALGHLFAEVKAMPDREARISVQYLEVGAGGQCGRVVACVCPCSERCALEGGAAASVRSGLGLGLIRGWEGGTTPVCCSTSQPV